MELYRIELSHMFYYGSFQVQHSLPGRNYCSTVGRQIAPLNTLGTPCNYRPVRPIMWEREKTLRSTTYGGTDHEEKNRAGMD